MSVDPPEGASQVRPYTLTSGRTRSDVDLPMEATLTALADRPTTPLEPSRAQIVELCTSSTPSVAEISSLIGAPLGVVRVLVGDLVHSGHLQVHATLSSDASSDERHDLIERTLRGLRDL